MNALASFAFEDRDVRIEMVDGEPWFCARHIAPCIGLKSVRDAVSKLDDEQRRFVDADKTPGRPPVFISRSGLSALIMQSRGARGIAARQAFAQAAMLGRNPDEILTESLVAAISTQPSENRVYFIRDESTLEVKIGVSRNVSARLRSIRRYRNGTLVLLGTEEAGYQREAQLNRRFSEARTSGEWFDPSLSADLSSFLVALS